MKFFSTAQKWFTSLISRFTHIGSGEITGTLQLVERLIFDAYPIVKWIGDVLGDAISKSHLPVEMVLESELPKFGVNIPDLKTQCSRLASKDRADMLLGIAVLLIQRSSASGVAVSVLRAAIELAYLIYKAEKAK